MEKEIKQLITDYEDVVKTIKRYQTNKQDGFLEFITDDRMEKERKHHPGLLFNESSVETACDETITFDTGGTASYNKTGRSFTFSPQSRNEIAKSLLNSLEKSIETMKRLEAAKLGLTLVEFRNKFITVTDVKNMCQDYDCAYEFGSITTASFIYENSQMLLAKSTVLAHSKSKRKWHVFFGSACVCVSL